MLMLITDQDRETFQSEGVVFLPCVFDKDWIQSLKEGVRKNLASPGNRMRIWDRSKKDKITLYDSDNWRRIEEYQNFVYEGPSKEIACSLLKTSKVNFFFDAIFVRSTGVRFPTPWHQDEPYWTVEGMDTVSFWMPLGPVEKRSALSFVPGSHRWLNHFQQKDFGKLNPDKQTSIDTVSFQGQWEPFPDIDSDLEKYKVVSWDMTPGDCVAFNGRTIHGGSGQLGPQCDLQVFNTKWLGDDVRVRFKPYGMDPDHTEKMQAAGMNSGDHVDNAIYPRFCLEKGCFLK